MSGQLLAFICVLRDVRLVTNCICTQTMDNHFSRCAILCDVFCGSLKAYNYIKIPFSLLHQKQSYNRIMRKTSLTAKQDKSLTLEIQKQSFNLMLKDDCDKIIKLKKYCLEIRLICTNPLFLQDCWFVIVCVCSMH